MSGGRHVRVLVLWGAAALASSAAPAPASAAVTASVQGTTLTITGDAADNTIAITVDASDPAKLDVDTTGDGLADFVFDRSSFDSTIVNAGAGNDTVTAGNGTAADGISINGEAGNDTLLGGDGGEPIDGGEGNDTIAGDRGTDVLRGGPGADTFTWAPGDGSDTVEGGDGGDLFVMNGSNANENIAVQPNGSRLMVTRDVGAVTQDVAGVETIDLRLQGGIDSYTGGTGLAGLVDSIVVDGGAGTDTLTGGDANETLSGGPDADTLQGGAGDDTFPVSVLAPGDTIDGGTGNDQLDVSGQGSSEAFTVDAPSAGQAVVFESLSAGSVGATSIERVRIAALGGNDSVSVTPTAATAFAFDEDGGDGNDRLNGGASADTLRGGAGNDLLIGGGGNDRLFGDLGDDTLLGQTGADEFHCAGPTDVLDATAEDSIDADCLPPPPPPVAPPVLAPDLTPPSLTLVGLPKAISRRALLRRGLSFTVRPSEAASLDADLLGHARRATISAAAPNVTLAHRQFGLALATRRVKLKPSKRLVGSARRFTLTVRIAATDASRNRATATRTIRVR